MPESDENIATSDICGTNKGKTEINLLSGIMKNRKSISMNS